MSEFHYVRTIGVDGGVDAADGPAIGVDLETLLEDGLPPHNIALEIIAALCEILDIADEDGEVHGDVTPAYVFIDDIAAISLEGYGTERDSSQAPEQRPEGTATDLYGLGYVAYRLLSTEPIDPPMDDPDAHDDEVIDAIIGIRFGDVPEEFHGDIQWYLAKLMGYYPEDRPSALEVWKAFIAFADDTPGPPIEDWAPQAIEGGGERREDTGRQEIPAVEEEEEPGEDLSGPTKMKGPLSRGAIDFSGGGAKSGSATAFWSKDAMKAALSEEPEPEPEPDARGGGGGGGGGGGAGYQPNAAASTSFWSKADMEKMREGEGPRPKRGGGRGQQRTPQAQAPSGPGRSRQAAPGPAGQGKGKHWAPTQPPEVDDDAQPLQNQAGPSAGYRPSGPQGGGGQPQQPSGPTAGQPTGQGAGISGPAAQGGPPQGGPPQGGAAGIAGPQPQAAEEEGGANMVLIAAVVGVFALLCLGAAAVGGGFFLMSGDEGEADDADVSTLEDPEPGEFKTDTGVGAPDDIEEPEAEPEPSPRPTTRPSPSPAPSPAPMTRPKPSPEPTLTRPSPSPSPAPTSGKVRVTFNLGTRGSVGCSDGQKQEVDGSKAFSFDGYNLPVSCMIEADGGMWAGLIEKGGTVSCSGSGGSFTCTPP